MYIKVIRWICSAWDCIQILQVWLETKSCQYLKKKNARYYVSYDLNRCRKCHKSLLGFNNEGIITLIFLKVIDLGVLITSFNILGNWRDGFIFLKFYFFKILIDTTSVNMLVTTVVCANNYTIFSCNMILDSCLSNGHSGTIHYMEYLSFQLT